MRGAKQPLNHAATRRLAQLAAPPNAHKCVLHNLSSRLLAAEHAQCKAKDQASITIIQQRKRAAIATCDRTEQRVIARLSLGFGRIVLGYYFSFQLPQHGSCLSNSRLVRAAHSPAPVLCLCAKYTCVCSLWMFCYRQCEQMIGGLGRETINPIT